MSRFLKDADYSTLIRNEIRDIIIESEYDEAQAETKLSRAEDMAIQQIKNYLHGNYNTEVIFEATTNETDTRNAHIVMITIDCALYHLYTSVAPNLIPEIRKNRYQDAIDWLKDVGKGRASADLPRWKDESGEDKFEFRIKSKHKPQNHKW